MTLSANEFMRRFLLHVLPGGFHRIRHCGLFANAAREANLAKARALLNAAPDVDAQGKETSAASPAPTFVCRECGAPMIIIDTWVRVQPIRAPPRKPNAP